MQSRAELVAAMSKEDRQRFLSTFSKDELLNLNYNWENFWARPGQLEPTDDDWFVWLIMAGRGFGKTRTGAEWVRKRIREGARRVILIGRTSADVRDVMIEGESGILSISPEWERPKYEPSKRMLTWPSGAYAITFSADKPDQLRGPQGDTCWADEIGAWRYPQAWHEMRLGLRSSQSGLTPRICATTTPRPTDLIRALSKDKSVRITRGTTFDNKANMAASYFDDMRRLYTGTRLGRQELEGELLEDNPGALWSLKSFDDYREHEKMQPDEFSRIIVGVDPAVSSNEESALTGIIVVGIKDVHIGGDKWTRHAYVLADRSGVYTPAEWAKQAINAYRVYKADAIVAEVNNGGDLVEANILNNGRNIRVIKVRASRGKHVRAEPAAMLYEQGRVHHVGILAELEDQLVSWDPATAKRSPDRMDALVWALWELIIKDAKGEFEDKDPTGESVEAQIEREMREIASEQYLKEEDL